MKDYWMIQLFFTTETTEVYCQEVKATYMKVD